MMAPLPFPDLPAGVARVSLEIDRVDYGAPETSGRQGGVQAGWPLWVARYELDEVDAETADMWRAFVTRLRGRQRLFVGHDTARPYPLAARRGFAGLARAGGGAFDGAALSWAQDIDADGNAAIALTGLPANLPLARGDYIGWRWTAAGSPGGSFDRRALARVVVPAVASGAGAITVTCEPPIDTRVVPAGAVAHLDKPAALFRQVPDKSDIGVIARGSTLSGATMIAAQDLRP